MGILDESLSAEDWHFVDEELDTRHPDRAVSYEVVPEGFVVRMWTIDNVNDITYGPFAIKPENRLRVQHFVNRLNKQPCPLGQSCPSQGIPQDSLSQQDWDALNRAVHQNYETKYAIVADGLVVRQLGSDENENEIIHGPYAIQPQYRQQVEVLVRARNA